MTTLLRPARAFDAAPCAAIVNDWIDATPWMPRIHAPGVIAWFYREHVFRHQRVTVAERKGEVVGFLALDPAKGSVTYQGPVLAGQRLFLTSSEGQALAFDPDNGNQLAALKLGAGAGLPPVVAGGTLYILDDAGTIHAFR